MEHNDPRIWPNEPFSCEPTSAVFCIRSIVTRVSTYYDEKGNEIPPPPGTRQKTDYAQLDAYKDALTSTFGETFPHTFATDPTSTTHYAYYYTRDNPRSACLVVVEATNRKPAYSCLDILDDVYMVIAEGVIVNTLHYSPRTIIPLIIAEPNISHTSDGYRPEEYGLLLEGARQRNVCVIETNIADTKQNFEKYLRKLKAKFDALTF